MHFTEQQKQQLAERKISESAVTEQIEALKKGAEKADVIRAARLNDGILRWSSQEQKKLLSALDTLISGKKIAKFVPASGAATRMFKDLFLYLETEKITPFVEQFFRHLTHFAFYPSLCKCLGEETINQLVKNKRYNKIISTVLLGCEEQKKQTLALANKPKALIPFYLSEGIAQTPIAEHIKEAQKLNIEHMSLYFTIPEAHRTAFEEEANNVCNRLNYKDLHLSYSIQEASTDAVAIDEKGALLTDEQQKIIFRPGGHGSLIKNLDQVDADAVFVRNIDNVPQGKDEENNLRYKKLFLSKLMLIQKQIFQYLEEIEQMENSLFKKENEVLQLKESIVKFFEKEMFVNIDKSIEINDLKKYLDRPIRICGMVKNEGEPGGGPFWVKNKKGKNSLQIVESAQLDNSNIQVQDILSKASHFNPVDMLCSLKDKNGKQYHLASFIDKDTYFISHKSMNGKNLKAYEHPGLWNGSMAFWNTIFVEIPLSLFNPVKTINDLIKE